MILSELMRIIPAVFQDIHDELILALNNIIPTVDEGMPQTVTDLRETFCKFMNNVKWAKIPIVRKTQHVICRISNRVSVGPTLCS